MCQVIVYIALNQSVDGLPEEQSSIILSLSLISGVWVPLPSNVGRLAFQVISAGVLLSDVSLWFKFFPSSAPNLNLSFFAGGYSNTFWEV